MLFITPLGHKPQPSGDVSLIFRMQASDLQPDLLSTSGIRNHLPELKFLRELPAELSEIRNKLLGALHEGFLRRDGAVGLHAEFDFGEEWVWDWLFLVWWR